MQDATVRQRRWWAAWLWCGLSVGLAVLLWLGGGFLAAQAADPCVSHNVASGCFDTIQAAVNAAGSDATITIDEGTYSGGVSTGGKHLTFFGAGPDKTFIDGGGTTRGFSTGANTDLELSNLTVQHGSSADEGGGIYAQAALTLTNVDVVSNTSANVGGGVYARGSLVLNNTRFFSNTSALNGGGAHTNANASVTGGLFQGNSAVPSGRDEAYGGGLEAATGMITGTQFVSNTSKAGGGGLYVSSAVWTSVMTMTNVVFAMNACTDADCRGGGVYANAGVTLSDTDFYTNSAGTTGFGGGGIYPAKGATILGGRFQNNTGYRGGGIGSGGTPDVSLVISGTQFIGNSGSLSPSSQGGALYLNSGTGGSATLINVYAANNSAAVGGAISASRPITITGGVFADNVARGGSGGGIYSYYAMTVTGATLLNNTAANAVYGYGGAIYQEGDAGQIVNTLFAGNFAAASGDGYYRGMAGGQVIILNSTFATPTVIGGEAIYVANGTVQVTNTLVASYTTGIQKAAGTVTEDYNRFAGVTNQTRGSVSSGTHSLAITNARFVDPAAGDYHLLVGSPAAGKGTDVGVVVDLDGTPRASPPSIGAYEGTAVPANLALAKTVSPTTAVPYLGTAIYTITLADTNAQGDPSAVITDVLPGGTVFKEWILQPTGAVRSTNAITWTGKLTDTGEIALVFAVTNTASGGVAITNTAWFSGTASRGSAPAAYTATLDCYPTGSGNWSVVFGACLPGSNPIIPAGFTVTLDMDITLLGSFEVQPGGSFAANGKTVTLAGSAAQTLSGSPLDFYNLVVDKSDRYAVVQIAGKLNVPNKLTIARGALVSASTYGDLEIASEGALTLTNPISITGSFTNGGELYTAGHAVNFSGGLVTPAVQNLALDVATLFDDFNVMTGTTLVEAVTGDNAAVSGTLANYGVIRKTQPIIAPTQYSFGLAGTYSGGHLQVDAGTVGALASLQVDRIDAPPAELPPQAPSIYWQITPVGAGYSVTLTLPHAGLANPYACRRVGGSRWDCARSRYDGKTVTRQNVTQFSDWAVFDLQATTTGVTATPNPGHVGQALTFTATVTVSGTEHISPTGAVTLTIATAQTATLTQTLNPAPGARNEAVWTVATLPAGSYTVTAEYSGDGSSAPSHGGLAAPLVVHPLPLAVNDGAGALQETGATIPVLANDLDPAGGGLTVTAVILPPAHGTALPTGDGKAVLYTPEPGFWGQDSFAYVAQDANGNSDDALTTVVVAPKSQVVEPPQIARVDPQVEVTTPFTGTRAGLAVQLPMGFFTPTLAEKNILFLSCTPIVTPTGETASPPGNLTFGNFEFDLALFLDDEPQHGVRFARPITVTITYDASILAGLQEEALAVYYWDGGAWSTAGITIVNRDPANHRITITLAHLSQFGFFAQKTPTGLDPGDEPQLNRKLFLPGVMRDGTAAGPSEQAVEPAEERQDEHMVKQEEGREGSKQLYLPELNR